MIEQDHDISYAEFEVALESLANNKSPGENEVSPNLTTTGASSTTALLNFGKAGTTKAGTAGSYASFTSREEINLTLTAFMASI